MFKQPYNLAQQVFLCQTGETDRLQNKCGCGKSEYSEYFIWNLTLYLVKSVDVQCIVTIFVPYTQGICYILTVVMCYVLTLANTLL